jgi:hypothetical protein
MGPARVFLARWSAPPFEAKSELSRFEPGNFGPGRGDRLDEFSKMTILVVLMASVVSHRPSKRLREKRKRRPASS